jgi:hypothetical protein
MNNLIVIINSGIETYLETKTKTQISTLRK